MQPPTPEPRSPDDVEVQLDRKPGAVDPADSTQYQIIEIMKNGKMIQVKVPKQEDLAGVANDPINEM